MIKITGKLDFADDLEKEIKTAFDQAASETVNTIERKLKEKAQSTLSMASYDRWDKGFSVDEVSPGTYVLTLTGEIANIIDRGWKAGEISKNLMEGPRATHNKAQGKDYVDVPIGVEKPALLDADALMNQFKKGTYEFSNRGQKGKSATRLEDRHTRRLNKKAQGVVEDRLKNIIESRKSLEGPSKFMVIKRVTKDTRWPATDIAGPRSFEGSPIDEIGKYFEEILEKKL